MSTIDTGKAPPKRALTQEDKAFLTKDECEAYIKAHKYDFEPDSHPRSYSMCASPNGAYARLVELLTNGDWDTQIRDLKG